jgi:hypothetical protein
MPVSLLAVFAHCAEMNICIILALQAVNLVWIQKYLTPYFGANGGVPGCLARVGTF